MCGPCGRTEFKSGVIICMIEPPIGGAIYEWEEGISLWVVEIVVVRKWQRGVPGV